MASSDFAGKRLGSRDLRGGKELVPMKKFVVAFAAAMVLAASMAVFAAPGKQDFVLINKTGVTIVEFYVSPTTTNDWEEDVLGVDTLPPGEDVEITFEREETACKWDLKVVDKEGDSIVWTNIDLCKAEEITILFQNGKPTAQIT